MNNISFICAGTVTFRLSLALQQAGYNIRTIVNRSADKAESVVRALKRHRSHAIATDDYNAIPADCDLIIISVSDTYIGEAAKKVNETLTSRNLFIPVVHTCGAVPLETLTDELSGRKCGVFYPLMTLSKNKEIDMKLVPFLIESNDTGLQQMLCTIVQQMRAEYKICDSAKRLQMHVAAVFVSNFTNYMLALAYRIAHPDFVYLLPCAVETVRKAFLNKPSVSQTGPAKRGDTTTINEHLNVLAQMNLNEEREIYEYLSRMIMQSNALGTDIHPNTNKANKENNE